LSALDELDGLACHAGGQDGTTSISFDTARRAVITCVVVASQTPLTINEFSTGVSGGATNEFVELFNADSSAVDIGGDRVVYRSANGTSETTLATIPSGTQLAAGAFYLLGGSGYTGPEPPDQTFGTSLSSTGGSIGIRSADGGLLDAAAYGTAANGLGEGQPATAPPLTPSPGSSAERLPDGADTDENAADFRVTATPTPREPNQAG
jgi:predicted extracellular nuclease